MENGGVSYRVGTQRNSNCFSLGEGTQINGIIYRRVKVLVPRT